MAEANISVADSQALLDSIRNCATSTCDSFANRCPWRISTRNGQVIVEGEEAAVAQATAVIEKLQEMARRQGSLSTEDVSIVLGVAQGSEKQIGPSTTIELGGARRAARSSLAPPGNRAMSRPCMPTTLSSASVRPARARPTWRSPWRCNACRQERDPQDRARPPGGRSGRKPGLPARRLAGQDQSLPAAAARRPARDDRLRPDASVSRSKT